MKIVGIDLAGPSNWNDTVMAIFSVNGGNAILEDLVIGASDQMIIERLEALEGDDVTIGIDAPLSYQDGGGDRPQDKALRSFMTSCGLNGSSVMPPTLTRMAYLTLRGISVTRRLSQLKRAGDFTILEVHPGAAIGSRIPDIEHALLYKKDMTARVAVLEWLKQQGLDGVAEITDPETHTVDALAASLAAWCFRDPSKSVSWQYTDISDEHPYIVCC